MAARSSLVMGSVLASVLAAALAAGPAGAADLAEPEVPQAPAAAVQGVPACDAPAVQSAVARTIGRAIPSYYDGARVTGARDIVETALVDDSTNKLSPMVRRYCAAELELSSGTTNPAYYMIQQNGGFVGVSWNVQTCLVDKDHWYVYGADCSTVRKPPSM